MRTVHHPTIRHLTYEVEDERADSWKDAGWRLTPIPETREAADDSNGDTE
jgi:hypothetical protein